VLKSTFSNTVLEAYIVYRNNERMKTMRILFVCCSLLCLLACGETEIGNDKKALQTTVLNVPDEININQIPVEQSTSLKVIASSSNNLADNYQEIEWTQLLPKTDLDALLNPPDYIMNVEDGSIEDQVVRKMENATNIEQRADNRYEKALMSTNVIEAMGGKNIEIPGFIVPINFAGEQIVTSFFLVPYFGACLHIPPPPPNQIIYVEFEQGFVFESLYEPVVVSGKLSIELFEDQVATSAYTMVMDKIRMYDES